MTLAKDQSFRRLLEAYWLGQLTVEEEKAIEDSTPKETIAAFKPVSCDRMHVSDLPPMPDPWERKLIVACKETSDEIDSLLKAGWICDGRLEFKRLKPFKVRQ